jgi:hypothetical protein
MDCRECRRWDARSDRVEITAAFGSAPRRPGLEYRPQRADARREGIAVALDDVVKLFALGRYAKGLPAAVILLRRNRTDRPLQ